MIITGRSDQVLFELAKFHAPSTIFLDELESVMGQRGGGHGSVQPHGQGGPGGTGLGSLVGPVWGGPGGTGLGGSWWDRSGGVPGGTGLGVPVGLIWGVLFGPGWTIPVWGVCLCVFVCFCVSV